MESKELMIASDPQVCLQRKEVATGLFKSGLFPNAKNEFGAYAIVQYGAELGLAPMVSLQNINVISGKLACNGQVMLSLAISRGVTFQVLEESAEKCSIKFTRGVIQYISHFTMQDAKDAGLTGKDNWNKWKRDMLFWRAVAKGVRRIAPEAVMGLYTADELTDGEVIDVSVGGRMEETLKDDKPKDNVGPIYDIHTNDDFIGDVAERLRGSKTREEAQAIGRSFWKRAKELGLADKVVAMVNHRYSELEMESKPAPPRKPGRPKKEDSPPPEEEHAEEWESPPSETFVVCPRDEHGDKAPLSFCRNSCPNKEGCEAFNGE